MENQSKRIIVTRPLKQSQAWVECLNKAGLRVATIPSLVIESVSQPEDIQAVKNVILALDGYDFLIFVSQNAVSFGFDWIEDFWPQFPDRATCLSIGAKTQQAVDERLSLYAGQACENRSTMGMDSESLLASSELQNMAGKKVLIFRGVGGRPKLYDELNKRSAKVDYCELYNRASPPNICEEIKQYKVNPADDILTVFSGETLNNFHRALQEAGVRRWKQLPVLVPSERVKRDAEALGFRAVSNAVNATEDEMQKALTLMLANNNL